MSAYRSGYCNIGRQQRRRRFAFAGVAFGTAALYASLCAVGVVPAPLLVAVFVPLTLGFEWGIQAYAGFCVRLALLSRYEFGSETGRVSDRQSQRDDRLQAAKITVISLVAAAGVTGVLVVALV